MKHYFIINPVAGYLDNAAEIKKHIEAYEEWIGLDWETYETTRPGDAAVFVSLLCKEHATDPIRIYACGGDGTLNEVVTGVMGHPNVQVAVFPAGTGNDFIRNFGVKSDFCDMDRLVEGTPCPMDILKVTVGRGDNAPVRYCINYMGLGIDSFVEATMRKLKHVPLVGGKNAYRTASILSFIRHSRNNYHVKVDGKDFFKKQSVLCTFNNGSYIGGGYNSAPFARPDDGVLDIYCIRSMSIMRFLQLLNHYRVGDFVDNPECAGMFEYTKGTSIEVECKKPMPAMIDGELLVSDYYQVELLHNALDFVIPQGIVY